MSRMLNTHDSEKKGVFVMSRATIKRFRKESKSLSGQYMGHKVRAMRSCPDEKIYLMSNEDYAELQLGVLNASDSNNNGAEKEEV